MSNIYGIKESQVYHFPPSKYGFSDPEPLSCGLFYRLIDSPDTILVNCDAGQFLYNVEGDLLAFELYVFQPDLVEVSHD